MKELDELSLDDIMQYLEKRFKYLSSDQAYVASKIVTYYKGFIKYRNENSNS